MRQKLLYCLALFVAIHSVALGADVRSSARLLLDAHQAVSDGDYAKGLALFEKVFRQSTPVPAESLVTAALAAEQCGEIKKAIRFAESALAVDKKNSVALFYLMKPAFKAGDMESVKQFASSNPGVDFSDFAESLGWIYWMEGKDQEALKWLEQAQKRSPNSPTIREGIPVIQRRLDSKDEPAEDSDLLGLKIGLYRLSKEVIDTRTTPRTPEEYLRLIAQCLPPKYVHLPSPLSNPYEALLRRFYFEQKDIKGEWFTGLEPEAFRELAQRIADDFQKWDSPWRQRNSQPK